MERMRLNTNDIVTIGHILDEWVKNNPHTEREAEYPKIFEAIADSMCWDDGIVCSGGVTEYVHG